MPPLKERLVFTSRPAMWVGLLGSIILLIAAMGVWLALGADIRSRVTTIQLATLLGFVLIMVAIMLSVGYSRMWAGPDGVTIRNILRVRKFKVADIVGVRMRKGDPWAYLLVKSPSGEEPAKHAILAIQAAEGKSGMTKVLQLRQWLDVALNGPEDEASAAAEGDLDS